MYRTEQKHNTAQRLSELMFKISRYSSLIPVIILGLVVLVTTGEAFSILIAGKPITGVPEITALSMILLCYLSLAYIERNKRMIIIDLFNSKLPDFLQFILDKLNLLLSLFFAGLITWQSFKQGIYIMQQKEVSSNLQLPLFPFYFIIAIGTILYALQLILKLIIDEKTQH